MAERLQLPFFDVGTDGRRPCPEPTNLRDELARLHFDEIKIRTLRGALSRVLDSRCGVQGYLNRIRAAAGDFDVAHRALAASEMARVAWPSLPPRILVDEIREWWDVARPPWSRKIHGFYRRLGQGVTWPIRHAWKMTQTADEDPLESFHRREREAIVLAVEKMLDELERLAQVGSQTLRPRLLKMLGGMARKELLERVETAHHELPAIDDDYRTFLRSELDAWQVELPGVVTFLRSLDHVAAVARPAITVLLFVSGWHVAGDLAGQAATHAATHTIGQLAQEAAIAGGITGGGEALVSSTSEGVRQAAGRLFVRLQSRYAQKRAEWLARWLEKELLGSVLAELRRGAEIPRTAAFRELETLIPTLESLAHC